MRQTNLSHLLHHISEVDGLCAADGGGPVVVHQLIEGIELDHPQEVLACAVSQNLEVLHPTSESR